MTTYVYFVCSTSRSGNAGASSSIPDGGEAGASGSASHPTEAQYVWGAFADPRTDLHGYRIDSATVTVNSLTANQYSAADNSYHTSGTVTLSIEGVLLPEPMSVLLFLSAATSLLACRPARNSSGCRRTR